MKTPAPLTILTHLTLISLYLSSEPAPTSSTPPEYPKHIIPNTSDAPELNYSPFVFKGGLANIPKLEKIETGGEDALFYSPNLLAVADGVGGWALQGIDSSKYSRKLIENARDFFQKNPEHYSQYPKDLLVECAKNNYEMGTSTLVLVTLWNKFLKVGFLGDSGYMILAPALKQLPQNRGYNIIWEAKEISKEQEHAFNFPFQIGMNGDDPELKAQAFQHEVSYGSLVIVMSDGVLDNFFPHDIEYALNEYVETIKMKHGRGLRHVVENFDGQYFSEYLAQKTYAISERNDFVSPFAVGAMQAGLIAEGGKMDDISVVAAMIRFTDAARPEELKVGLCNLYFYSNYIIVNIIAIKCLTLKKPLPPMPTPPASETPTNSEEPSSSSTSSQENTTPPSETSTQDQDKQNSEEQPATDTDL
jgi:protein phosphatase PTC7